MAKPPAQVQVKGINPLVRALKRAGDADMLAALKDANAEAAGKVHAAAAPRVPVESGSLLASLRGSATERAGYVRAALKRLPYGPVVHFGWPRRGIAPQPFLFDALDSRRTEVEAVFASRIEALASRIQTGPSE
jgi:hypothetical protein